MKTKTILTLALALILFLSACQQQKEERVAPIFTGEKSDLGEKAIITGRISNRFLVVTIVVQKKRQNIITGRDLKGLEYHFERFRMQSERFEYNPERFRI